MTVIQIRKHVTWEAWCETCGWSSDAELDRENAIKEARRHRRDEHTLGASICPQFARGSHALGKEIR